MSSFMDEINAIQTDLVCIEGMLDALANGAYFGTRVDHIGNSLEILREYLGQRSDRLNAVDRPFRMIRSGNDDRTGESLSDKCSMWEEFASDSRNMERQSREVAAEYSKLAPYLAQLPDAWEIACELGAASRKQGFIEGMMAIAGRLCGQGGEC